MGPLFDDTDFTTGVFAEMYSALGQPGLSPALLSMVMILRNRHNLSDVDAAAAVRDRISWKYALGLDPDDAGFDASVLTEFRTRLAEEGRADGLLELMLDRLKAADLVKPGGRQRTDSTHVIACVRQLNRIETVGETLRVALEAIAAINPAFIVTLLESGWDERYGRRVETCRLLGRKNASAQVLADQIGADGAKLLAAIDTDSIAGWMNDLAEVQVLRTVFIWKRALRSAGVPATRDNGMHALRHFFASVVLDGGASIKDLAEWLGHEDPGFTLRVYMHLLPNNAEKLRGAVDRALDKPEADGPSQ